jgi:deoxyribose-phosphate aldolase
MDPLLIDLNRRFDFASLNSEVTEDDIRTLCAKATTHDVLAVCVNPVWVKTANDALAQSPVRLISVAGFPLGAVRTDQKVFEAAEAVLDGAQEIDLVANIGWLCSNRFVEAEAEIRKIRRNLPDDVLLKVIIEASKLTELQQIEATRAVVNAGAQFVKTGTGFFGPATVAQVATLVSATRGEIEVKASGGIRSLSQCLEFLHTGATRLGTSSCVNILNELRQSTP